MPRAFNSLAGRLIALQLVILAVLTPILFRHLDTVVRTSTVEAFTHHARAYARSLASELSVGDALESPSRSVFFLDGSVESGNCLYAAIEFNGRLLGSSLTETPAAVQARGDDIDFGKSADSVYAISLPIERAEKHGALYLGFDKGPTMARLDAAHTRILLALVGYAAASLFASAMAARLVSRPLTQLQRTSRRIASGDTAARLSTDSTMIEIVNLSKDLELMHGELTGSAARLRVEMQRREAEQAKHAALESQLRHEQRLATVGTFAGGLAHEFNNILVPLLLFTEEALSQLDAAHPARSDLERVVDAANSASSVIAKLLAFSRPRGECRPQPFDLAGATLEALELIKILIPPNVELTHHMGASGELVLGDPVLWNQVLLNLCSNAVHAMGATHGTLSVTVGRPASAAATAGAPAPASPRVEVRVQDTGVGMEPGVQERIFEPFFTTREVGEGSGLGLAVVHGIVTSMDGIIRVRSEPGAGTTFTVDLPIVTGSAA